MESWETSAILVLKVGVPIEIKRIDDAHTTAYSKNSLAALLCDRLTSFHFEGKAVKPASRVTM